MLKTELQHSIVVIYVKVMSVHKMKTVTFKSVETTYFPRCFLFLNAKQKKTDENLHKDICEVCSEHSVKGLITH